MYIHILTGLSSAMRPAPAGRSHEKKRKKYSVRNKENGRPKKISRVTRPFSFWTWSRQLDMMHGLDTLKMAEGLHLSSYF